MNRLVAGTLAVLLCAVFGASEADAARMGGGRSLGAQRSIANAPPAKAPARAAPQAQQAAPAQQPAASPATQGAGTGSKWMPILGGLALGGILGSLFGGSVLGALLAAVLMLAVIALAATIVARMLSQRRAQTMRYAFDRTHGTYPALGAETVAAPPPSQAGGLEAYVAPRTPAVPAGFDVTGFLRAAKLNFMRLQAANDAGDLDQLREFTAPEVYEQLRRDVLGRPGSAPRTDVVSLDAALLEVVTEGDRHWASVRFSGVIRDLPGSAPGGFEEVWNLAKPTDGSSGWVLAGIQQMH